ncbi:hypothetical protein C8F04DRAFT_1191922 [Mycena alexandri]|uniref:Uncharacterized protein n=1 Tax=Mycena alexandri TaxID=1745969 RepID=A0AAD6SDI8_9AGAR|nr:hypothetical protein C8F04DRAFT_1191922 [Mycena alexandri]
MGYGRYHDPGQKCWPWYLPWARRRREENLARGTTHGHPSNPSGSKDQKGFISGIWAPFGLPKGLLQSLDPGLSACEVGATSEHIKFVLSAYRAACKLALVRAFGIGQPVNWLWCGHSVGDWAGTGLVRKPCPRAVGIGQPVNWLWCGHSVGDWAGTGLVRKPCPRAVGGYSIRRTGQPVNWLRCGCSVGDWAGTGLVRKPCPRAVAYRAARKLAPMRAFGGRLGWYWAFRKPCPTAVGGALAARKSVLVQWVFALVLALLEWPDLGLSMGTISRRSEHFHFLATQGDQAYWMPASYSARGTPTTA